MSPIKSVTVKDSPHGVDVDAHVVLTMLQYGRSSAIISLVIWKDFK